MKDTQRLKEELALVKDLIETQARYAGCPDSLREPDFWILGYSGGLCRYVLERWGLQADTSDAYSYMLSTFCGIFGAAKGPRMTAYFFTFYHFSKLLNEVANFGVIAKPENDDQKPNNKYRQKPPDFLEQVRGIYRKEVFDKFFSLSYSIRDVIMEGEKQARLDVKDFFSDLTSVQPKGLSDYLLANTTK